MGSINKEALYCAGTAAYRSPEEPNTGDVVRLRFRTARGDADAVSIRFAESGTDAQMRYAYSDQYFDYYEYELTMGTETVSYSFEVRKGEEWIPYNRMGVSYETAECFCFQLIPNFHTPEWAKGVVMYQIFVDRFRNGSKKNDVLDYEYVYLGMPVSRVKNWAEPVSTFDVARFYGGDLQGVIDKLNYIYKLGVRCIYFNPLFVSPSNHKYDMQDYAHIDPHYGEIVADGGRVLSENETDNRQASRYSIRTTEIENLEASDELFARLVNTCHEIGLRVIVDGVFNHCGSFHRWMNRSLFYADEDGAYQSKDSHFRDYFRFQNQSDEAWPNNDSYEQWWGNDTLPKLNYEDSHALEEEVLAIARRWVSPPFNCDGWRLDVAADLGHSEAYNHSFWKRFRKAVKEANPNAIILAEHYGDPYAWLRGDEWDTIMNYDAFMEPVSWFLTGMEKHSDEHIPALRGDGEAFFRAMDYHMSRMPESSLLCSMNELSNHDHSRFMTRTNMQVGRLASRGAKAAEEGINVPIYRLAAMIQMTWPGAPTIYYGDEAGVCGWTDPDSRRPYPWGQEDLELLEYHRYLTGTHRRNPVFQRGAWMKLLAGQDVIVYGRLLENEVGFTAINAGGVCREIDVPVWKLGITDEDEINRILLTGASGYNAGMTKRKTKDGVLRCVLGPYEGKIYTAKLQHQTVATSQEEKT